MVREMQGGSMLQVPSSAVDLLEDQTRADLDRYVRWPGAEATERIKLLKLLWDLTGSEFASRQVQYEMCYAGQPAAVQVREYRTFDWGAADALVQRCLAGYDVDPASQRTGRQVNYPLTTSSTADWDRP